MKFLVILFLSLVQFACSGAVEVAKERHVFPLPPEKPRVEWLGTYMSEDDFPKTQAERTRELLVGKPPLQFFAGPTGIASDGEGKVFAGDLYRREILVYDLNQRTVSSLGDQRTMQPRQMLFDSRKQLYVVDSANHNVTLMTRDGVVRKHYGSSADLENPQGVAVDEKNRRLYVSDGRANKIVVYDLDGRKLKSFGESGNQEGQLYAPQALAIGPDGNLYVAEQLNARISVFTPEGEFVRYFGTRDDTRAGFQSPRGIAFDSEGNLWVTEFRAGALRAYTTEGRVLFDMTGPVTHKMGFATPYGLYIDEHDEIFLTDFLGQKFLHWRFLSKKALEKHPLPASLIVGGG